MIYIPLEAIFKDQGNIFVYVKTAGGFKRQDVKLGASNTDFAIVTEGLEENDELALADPFLNKEEGKDKKEGVKNTNKAISKR